MAHLREGLPQYEPASAPPGLGEALGVVPIYVGKSLYDYLIEVESEERVRKLKPDLGKLKTLSVRGVIVTSAATTPGYDFVSRFFAPRAGVPEDPVTGSAHSTLVPYWSERLKKTTLHTFQISKRGGELYCQDHGDRVQIAGKAVMYLQGTITI